MFEAEDVEKVLVSDFHYNFFPCSFDVSLQLQSDFNVTGAYGTPYDKEDSTTGKHLESRGNKTKQFNSKVKCFFLFRSKSESLNLIS